MILMLQKYNIREKKIFSLILKSIKLLEKKVLKRWIDSKNLSKVMNFDGSLNYKRFFYYLLISSLTSAIISIFSIPIGILVFGGINCGFFFKHLFKIKKNYENECKRLESLIPILKLMLRFLLKICKEEQDISRIFAEMLGYIDTNSPFTNFKELISKITMGSSPEESIGNYHSFSSKFTEFICKCTDRRNIKQTSEKKNDFNEYRSFIKTIESRIVIIMAESIFLPILLGLVFIFNILNELFSFCFIVIHFLILKYISSLLLNKKFNLIYTNQDFSLSRNQELDELIAFLYELGINLESKSPEMAMISSLSNIKSTKIFNVLLKGFESGIIDFYDALITLEGNLKLKISKFIILVILKLQKLAGIKLGRMLIEITKELDEQKRIDEEKLTIIKAERFKIKILVICLPIILSIMVALLPFFQNYKISSIFGDIQDINLISFYGTRMAIFIISNLMYIIVSTYFLTKIGQIRLKSRYIAFSASIFLVCLISSTFLLYNLVI